MSELLQDLSSNLYKTNSDLTELAVDTAIHSGAKYADARLIERRHELISAQNDGLDPVLSETDIGIGIRALYEFGWGFASTGDLSLASIVKTGFRAAKLAQANALASRNPMALAPTKPQQGQWISDYQIDPFSVPLSDKADLLTETIAIMRENGCSSAKAHVRAWHQRKWLSSSEGHQIYQESISCGGGLSAISIDRDQTQRRSYPCFPGNYALAGWEYIQELDLLDNAPLIGAQSRELLTAYELPYKRRDLIIADEQMAMQIHETVGHAVELDRILGWEAAYAGRSWLSLPQLGELRFGAQSLNVTADPTLPKSLGSFGFDDEGTPASRLQLIKNGIWVGVLGGRDCSGVARLTDIGSVRTDGYGGIPLTRITNVGLELGDTWLEEMIDQVDDGLLITTNRSWSIDDKRRDFQFGGEIGWEIKRGTLSRIVRNPVYRGSSPQFWASLTAVGREQSDWGMPSCGKGQPGQIAHTGHLASPGLFTGVETGTK